jgi:two-component system, LytTR family, sensor kinase
LFIDGRHIRNGLIRLFVILRKRWVYHAIFWVVLYVSLLLLEDQGQSLGFRMLLEFINVFFYAALVYVNIFYLIPNYLTGSRLWIYTLLFITTCLIFTPIKLIVLFFAYNNAQDVQQFIVDNQPLYFLIFLLAGSLSTVYSIFSEWKNQEKDQIELEKKNIETELRFLKTQINPHFLFNTLNSLYSLTLKKSDTAPDVVLMLSEMMRYMLYECNDALVPLEKEVNYIDNYLNLERLRVSKKVNITFEQQGKIHTQTIAPLLFIPFIENAFKHGISHAISEAYIRILLKIEDDNIYFEVENSKSEKLPFATTALKSGGIGLINVKRRLDLLYAEKNELMIENNAAHYKIILRLQL